MKSNKEALANFDNKDLILDMLMGMHTLHRVCNILIVNSIQVGN